MKKTVLFGILPNYADWEYAFIATTLQDRIQDRTSPYEVRTLSVSREPIKSLGGFTTIPDYSVDDYPADYAGLVLIGGTSWRSEEAKLLGPIAKQACADGKVVGGICDATVFLGMHGLLSEKQHTSNTLDDLSSTAGANYTGSALYRHEQAVRDGNLVTANGSATLEFMKEMLTALDAYPADYIESSYQFYKQGYIAFMQGMAQ